VPRSVINSVPLHELKHSKQKVLPLPPLTEIRTEKSLSVKDQIFVENSEEKFRSERRLRKFNRLLNRIVV